jgi:hypothetical protein
MAKNIALLTILLGCSLAGCNDRIQDCHKVCLWLRDCLAQDLNVSRCSENCADLDGRDQTSAIDECASCVADASCADSIGCSRDCVNILRYSW